MKPETYFAVYTIIKACFLGYCAYMFMHWPLFLALPAGLFVSLVPLASEAAAIYLGAQVFGTSYWMMALIVLLPVAPAVVWLLVLVGGDYYRAKKAKGRAQVDLAAVQKDLNERKSLEK